MSNVGVTQLNQESRRRDLGVDMLARTPPKRWTVCFVTPFGAIKKINFCEVSYSNHQVLVPRSGGIAFPGKTTQRTSYYSNGKRANGKREEEVTIYFPQFGDGGRSFSLQTISFQKPVVLSYKSCLK